MPKNGLVIWKEATNPREVCYSSSATTLVSLGWGRVLRRYSLDELPQLINVLWGEMSLVGPRPLQLRDSDRLLALDAKAYAERLQVLPGLTGPWQVGGRSEVDYQRMIELDLDYVENRSMGQDLRIICKTFFVVLLGRGAY